MEPPIVINQLMNGAWNWAVNNSSDEDNEDEDE